MMALSLADAVKADLLAILDYGTDAFGVDRAETYLRRLTVTFDRVREFPAVGQLHGAIRPPIRSMPCGSRRIYYDVLPDRVLVRRVLHKAMDAERWLDN